VPYPSITTSTSIRRPIPEKAHRRPEPSHHGHRKKQHVKPTFNRGYRATLGPEIEANSRARRGIERQVSALSNDQLLERFHYLVDRSLHGTIGVMEALELDYVEARLDCRDQAEIGRATNFQRDWENERAELFSSIERLIADLRAV
jgi:hypothetical protein